jgi:Phage MuF-C-terminal domain
MRTLRSRLRSSSSRKRLWDNPALSESWVRAVNAVIRGDGHRYRFIRLGPTPASFRRFGMLPFDLAMSAAKIARIRRDHPEISLKLLHALPGLICDPLAVFPSIRRDGSMVFVLVVRDSSGDPVIVAVAPDAVAGRNVVLSVYGKNDGFAWVHAQLAYARADGCEVFEGKGFAASVPKPGSVSEDTIPSSPGPIPVDGTTKPRRQILQLRGKSSN